MLIVVCISRVTYTLDFRLRNLATSKHSVSVLQQLITIMVLHDCSPDAETEIYVRCARNRSSKSKLHAYC